MKPSPDSNRGFTLIELLIVVVVLAVLAALAVPIYEKAIEKSRRAEALEMLSGIRRSEMRFYSEHRTFSVDGTLLDFNPDEAKAFQTTHFTYEITNADTKTFTATATRNIVDAGDGVSTVTINEAGQIGGTFGGN